MLKSATLLGSSSGRNTGDAALIGAIMDAVDEACGAPLRYEIPTIRPSYIRDNYRSNARPVSMLPWSFSVKMLGIPTYRSIRRTDLTLIFDAILFDRSLYNPLFNFMSTLRLLLPRAKKKGKLMGCYDVGVGPVNLPAGRRMLREILELMDFITVRDEDSHLILRDVGVENPRVLVAADAALNAPSSSDERVGQIFEEAGIKPDRPILAVNINRYVDTWASPSRKPMGLEAFVTTYAAALNRAARELLAQVVFVTTQPMDLEITRALMDHLHPLVRPRLISNERYNHADMKAVLRKVDLLFGMRLHSIILASAELTPVIGITYQPKVAHYFGTLGLGELSLGFEDFSEDSLFQHIVTGWANRERIKARLEEKIPALQKRARKPAALIAALHRGENVETALAGLREPPKVIRDLA